MNLLKTLMMILAVAASGGRAEELVFTVLAGPGPHRAGEVLRLDWVALNPGGLDAPFEAPPTTVATLVGIGHRTEVALRAVGTAPVLVPAGGFAVRRYEIDLPTGLVGDVVLAIARHDGPALRVALAMQSPDPDRPIFAINQPDPIDPSPLERLGSVAPASSALARNFAGRFMPNQPIYFIYGDDDLAAKFQFSFDYRLATFSPGSTERPRTDTLRIGYTQRSVWDVDGDSSPFYDTSYMPEIAFNRDLPMPENVSQTFTWLGWRVALQHESNGRDEAESRSLNTVYFRPRFVLGTLGKWAFVVLPEVQLYLGESSENPDIKDYRGYGRLRLYFGHNDGPSLQVVAWAGEDFDHRTWQLDLAVPTRLRWLNLESYFYVQYFNGYGESLRDYRLRSETVRLGVALVR